MDTNTQLVTPQPYSETDTWWFTRNPRPMRTAPVSYSSWTPEKAARELYEAVNPNLLSQGKSYD